MRTPSQNPFSEGACVPRESTAKDSGMTGGGNQGERADDQAPPTANPPKPKDEAESTIKGVEPAVFAELEPVEHAHDAKQG